MYGYKWKPSKTAKREFAKKMQEIEQFCIDHGIQASYTSDSYYFNIDGINYRVSNHTIEKSNASAFKDGLQVRNLYHPNGRKDDTVYIHASKTRIIEIYNNLKSGKKLNGKGEIIG